MIDTVVIDYPIWVYMIGWLLSGVALFFAYRQLSFAHFADQSRQHIWLAITVMLLLLWVFRAGLLPGLNLHLLGVVTLVLVVGWPWALFSFFVIVGAMPMLKLDSVANIGVTFPLMAILPALWSWWWFRLIERYLPNHLFVYLFITVFANAALTMIMTMVANGLLHWMIGEYTLAQIINGYWSIIPLIAFPEAIINGFIMTGLVVLHPDLVLHYNDQKYLG